MTVKKAKGAAALLEQAMALVGTFSIWADMVNNAHAPHLCAGCLGRLSTIRDMAQKLKRQFNDTLAPAAPKKSRARGKKEKLGGKGVGR
jgi:hypothetical protein